jgi:hypothetical protein
MTSTKRPHLSKIELLTPKIKSIDVEGGLVAIRALNASYAVSLRGKDLGDNEIFEMLSKSICDENGDPMLTPEEVGQIALTSLNQIVQGVMAFNSMSEGKAADDLKKTTDFTSPTS